MRSEEAFPRLVESHYAALYRFALSLARNPSEAGDLTHQTFFIWATKGHALRDETKAKTWLFTTLYREFLRGRRRESRVTSLDDLGPNEEPSQVGVDLIAKMDGTLVMAALQEVDLVFREPLTLFYLQDLSYLEIASILSVPIGTVMSRLSRGKAQLRSLLAHRAEKGAVIEFPRKDVRS